MNLQALYSKVKKEEEERLGKTGSKKRVITQNVEHKSKKPKPSPSSTTSSSHHTSTLQPRPHSSLPTKSKYLHPAPPHQQPSKKKTKPTITPEDSREIVFWFYNTEDKWFEAFRGNKAIFKMTSKDIKTLSELPLNNPSQDPKGYEIDKLLEISLYVADTCSSAEEQICCGQPYLLKTKVAADRQMISSCGQLCLAADQQHCC
ncbi:hypothetical protein L1987_09493 [Smallanthus sonchifolius]|uniref:Uncharacterized protein n=1 Tax=Smallanthus sonchifolius TaxID=185202 RepID=A0ACB9JNJ4_9ASTR|nr:hypothetical protein L1987_09493 [Smallanthus sonchifolius]